MPSTVISHFSFDSEKETLQVTFISGITYEYKGVPERVYLEMKASFSKGVFFNRVIKGNYDFTKVTRSKGLKDKRM